jgi:hypothetical protein
MASEENQSGFTNENPYVERKRKYIYREVAARIQGVNGRKKVR